MKLGISLKPKMIEPNHLEYFRQFGCESIIGWVPLPAGDGIWHLEDLLRLKDLINRHDMEFTAIEGIHPAHWDHIVLDEPGKERQMADLQQTIRNMGKAGIPCLSYLFSIVGVWGYYSERDNREGRGGAKVKKFDVDRVPTADPPGNREFWFRTIQDPSLFEKDLERRPAEGTLPQVEQEKLWERLHWFLSRAVPVAEEAGVILAAHPDDPPVPKLRGIARLLHTEESLQRLLDLVPSPSNRLAFCQGTISTMNGVKILDTIRRFAGNNNIAYVHFRNVRGKYPRWQEVFIDEGDTDMIEAMRVYGEAGFQGTMIPDHTPHTSLPGELWWETGMVHGLGYMQACRQAINKFPPSPAEAVGGTIQRI
jgi:mannonate dehydratase